VIDINIQEIKLKDLKMYENNPRINDKAVKYVANSIKNFGFLVPIVIDKDNVIVCGHTRYLASQELNLKVVPCIRVENLTDKQIKAFRIADNKIHEKSSWNNDLLKEELTQLQDFGFDLEDFGFLDFELNYILSDNAENFINNLEENDFNGKNLLNEFFSLTFVFSKNKEELIKGYIVKTEKKTLLINYKLD
jgi:Predicted transcriptional regulators